MGASDSKLVFKKGIFRLSEERNIPADDPYWTSFWDLPESPEDIFSLFSPADIRRTRDTALENLETLLLAVTSRLFSLRHHAAFPDPDVAPERDALNCIRVLTRVLPYIYERASLSGWEERFFWTARRRRTHRPSGSSSVAADREVLFDQTNVDDGPKNEAAFEDVKPLAEELIDTLTDLLFFADFTVTRPPAAVDPGKVTYAIWQSGVGCNAAMPTTREFESNRCEILRLLLTLASPSMYSPPGALPRQGIRALTYICTCPDKQVVLSVLCSLLNTTLKYNPASWRMPYNSLVLKDQKQILVTYTLQLLLVLVLYPVPEHDGFAPKNYYRHFLGRLHRPADFQFLVDGMTRILHQPLQANASYIPGTQSSVRFAPEIIMLFWEITQCNRRFRSFLIDTERVHDFVILILFYALESRNDGSKQGIVRMCVFLLQTLSVEKNFGINLNRPFAAQETLPPAIRIQGFRGTYADFLVQSIYSLITSSQSRLTAIYPALLAIINNVAPHIAGLSLRTCSRLMQLFGSMSSPSFLLANDTNHDLLSSLLEAFNATIEHQYKSEYRIPSCPVATGQPFNELAENPQLVYTIVKNKRRFEALRNFTLESGREEIERRMQLRKDSGVSAEDPMEMASIRSSVESLRSPSTPQHHVQPPVLSNVPENETFAIGGDESDSDAEADSDSETRTAGAGAANDDDDNEEDEDEDEDEDEENEPRPTPSQSSLSENPSGASSVISVEDAVPIQLRGMSEKARGKMPVGTPSFSRQNSALSIGSTSTGVIASGGHRGHHRYSLSHGHGHGHGHSQSVGSIGSVGCGGGYFEPTAQWIDSWLPELPLHTTLTLIQQLTALLPREELAVDVPATETLRRIQDVQLVGIDPSPIRVHSFEWSPLSLGWYESLIWSFIFSSEMQVARGTVGVWNGTAIKLFRVQETAPQGPSLTSPRGAVDAVGSNIVSRIGAINLRGSGGGITGTAGGNSAS
ncbi:hypothetical protein CMQ_2622 [Grosmannia clavigera kw1407]|uniref:High-temperature-induced dauer-formation protein n=1 Tax=Grosmannia clavigera (strain kw1407 / UAMH 11150) TaxID=655863 RepID=F0XG74_GROCL|nr:uncharacterized protein CMQ_2622 [Grosmannia clavigera kw1407]EFX02693.1 hypothetical protein CMQ_2622 [Grosmannia clavigera kw1407]